MWEMLIKGGKDLQLEFSDVKADEKRVPLIGLQPIPFLKQVKSYQ